jgi:hypothetical protein
MVDIKSVRCSEIGCKKRPTFNFEGQSKAIYCATHKKDGMIDIKNVRCSEIGCKKSPAFNFEGQSKAIYCATHKKDGMIDIKNARCIKIGCKKRPTFNFEGQSKAIYCATHKKDGMIDIKNVRCSEIGCKIHARFGQLYGPARHCAKHKQANEFIARFPTCQKCSCRPICTDAENHVNYPLYCDAHMPTNARVIVDAMCAQCKQESVISTQSRLCSICEFTQHHQTYHHYKEEQTIAAILAIGLHPTSCDKILPEGIICDIRKRPDIYFDLGSMALILEIDECQHARAFTNHSTPYACDCEFARMVAIHQVCGMPTVFIRFNPDEFTDRSGTRIPPHKSRFAFIAEYTLRMIRDLRASPVADGLYVAYLFYNGCADRIADRFRIDYMEHTIQPWIPS